MSIGKSNYQLTDELASRPEQSRQFSAGRMLKGLARRVREHRRRQDRRSLLESLEQRHLMAGPNLVGIQPNESSLLIDGSVINSSPRELVFRFDDSTAIDPMTLDGIRLTRAGDDAVFEAARATSDLGTGGAVLLEFRASKPGTAGEGLVVAFKSSSRTTSGAPIITIAGNVVTFDLNSNPARPTQVRDLISAVNANAAASQLLQVFSVSGPTSFAIGTVVPTGTKLTLRGANAADAVSDLGTSNAVRVRFISTIPGSDGRGTRIILQRADAGGPANPLVLVDGNQVTVRVNSNVGNETTVAQLVTAINSNPDASQIITAVLEAGSASTVVGNRPGFAQSIALTGASDVLIQPGFVGIGNSPNEVVFRFAEALPDDTYQIDIFGSGPLALTNIGGEAFNNGLNASRRFTLNVGPQVLAVVPEPIRRTANGLSPEIGIIEVHFDNDALDPVTAQNPAFYQLVYTSDTVNPADDRTVNPTSVVYNRSTNIARLTFNGPLSRLPNGSGGFLTGAARLRVGATQSVASAPQTINVGVDPGDSTGTSFAIGDLTSFDASGTRSVRLNSVIENTVDYGLQLPGAGAPGVRSIRPDDPGRLLRTVPLDYFRQGPDSVNGISTIQYDFASTFKGDDPNIPGIDTKKTYFNLISDQQRQRVREVLSLFSEYLGVQFVEVPSGPSAGAFFSISVGDLYGANEAVLSGPGGLAVATRDRDLDGVPDLAVLDFQDFEQSNDDQFGGEFFRGAMLAVGQLLGYGYADGLPQPVTQSTSFVFSPGTDNEPAFPSVSDIINGQYLYRPDSTDVDMYRFTLQSPAKVSIQTFAERLSNASLLNTQLRLYRQDAATGAFIDIAQNDDYFSNDSLIELELTAGNYLIGVSASGNNTYDPVISGTGFGGKSEGAYELRVTTVLDANRGIRDETGVLLDGDSDGHPGGVYDFWFVPADQSNTLYVDKAATTTGTGTIAQPFRNLNSAVAAAAPGTTIRVVANGGVDGLVETPGDNFSYQIGLANNGTSLADGTSLDLPQGITLVIDAGVVFKMRSSRVGVGSTAPLVNRSNSAIQILGTPALIASNGFIARNSLGEVIPGSVYFTSFNDSTLGRGNVIAVTPAAQPGDWGGIDLRGDIDFADSARRNRENEGVFLNHLQFADLRYGGGQVQIDGRAVVVSPIDMALTRATIINSRISLSADAAIAATPDTFSETRFDEAVFQQNGAFVPSVMRVGPEIHGNRIVDNTINGLFIRVTTRTGDALQPLTSQARFDDTDIVHVLTENLTIQGTPGGPVSPAQSPSSLAISTQALAGGGQVAAGTYVYRVSFASATTESAASGKTVPVTLSATGQIVFGQLPTVPAGSGFTQRRIYRASVAADGTVGDFLKVADLNGTDTAFIDRAVAGTIAIPNVANRLVARPDARLKIDPGTIVKTGGARIDVTFGADLIAEGDASDGIVFTSLKDQRYGTGGSFDTNSDGSDVSIAAGDWGGIYVGQTASASLDRVTLAGAGGSTRVEGGFASFNPIEVHQGHLRLSNSRLEINADGRGIVNASDPDRIGRGENNSATIFVRGAQPVLVNNNLFGNNGFAFSFDVNSLTNAQVNDSGRSTGAIDAVRTVGNYGPLVAGNRLTQNEVNGLQVRGGTLATEGVWDDVDIVHVVTDTVEIPNQHIYGGLRLQSASRGSLVIKLLNGDKPAAIVAGGSLLTGSNQFVDIADRIGGSLVIAGTPDFPVILTSLFDDGAGAGFDQFGNPQNETVKAGFTGGSTVRGKLSLVQPDSDVLATAVGPFGVSTDGLGVDGAGLIRVDLPVNATVEQAYLHVATRTFVAGAAGEFRPATIGLGGATVPLTFLNNVDDAAPPQIINFGVGFADVTSIIKTVTAGQTGIINVPVDESLTGNSGQVEGVTLTVIYRDPSLPTQTVLVLNGGLTSSQANRIRFQDPIDTTVPGFVAEMRLGISYSTGNSFPAAGIQTSLVDVNGVRLTSAAGGFDDATPPPNNGKLITYGGIGDLPDNPGAPNDPLAVDDERYSLTPFLSKGQKDIVINTENPSNNDSIFVTTFLFTGKVELGPAPTAGDYTGLVIREGASDRNVAGFREIDSNDARITDSNAVPSQSQFLGELAPNPQSGDENRRLGFVVDGVITRPKDIDVYSFIGQAGTQVWLDIDRTGLALDSIVELVNANGQTLALSDDSLAESRGDFTQLVSGGFEQSATRSLNTLPVPAGSSTSAYQDLYSTNARDAGLRVVLPGAVGSRNLYHVRVRSSSVAPGGNHADLLTNLKGLTEGAYRLQVRLGETDENPGSQVRFADVRYATKGLQVIGQPLHNPLIGDKYETSAANDTLATAQPLGLFEVGVDATVVGNSGPLSSDRLAKSVGGVLSGATDADWYRFNINYQNITRDNAALYLSTVFDIDYADGFARSDTAIYVFNGAGQLILTGGNSNVADDQPTGRNGTNASDLTRGSGGTLDPFIGSAELAEGNYFVAVVNQSRIPTVLNQFQTAVTLSPLLRLEPIDSVTRIAEDHIESVGGGTAGKPTIPMLFNEGGAPSASLITLLPVLGAGAIPGAGPNSTGTYVYRISYFSATSESAISGSSVEATLSAVGGITLSLLPVIPLDSAFTGRRLYRATIGANGAAGAFLKVAELNATDTTFTDRSATGAGIPPQVSQSVIPYTLNDVVLYSQSGNSVGLRNALTGTTYAGISTNGIGFRDFAIHPNGELFTYTFPDNTVNADLDVAYSYTRINGETGAATSVGFSGLQTFQNGPIVQGNQTVVDSNDGFQVEGMTYRSNGLGYIVGNRPINRNNRPNGTNGRYFQNILYAFDPQSGRVTGLGAPDRQVRTFGTITIDERADGAGTQIRERGYIETGAGPGITPVLTQLVVPDATRVNAAGGTTVLLDDGDAFSISAGAGSTPFRIELDSGPVLNFVTDSTVGAFPIDGTVFSLTTSIGTQVYELDSGPVIVIDSTQVIDGANVTVRDTAGTTRVFEFNSNGVLSNPNAISVPFVLGAQSNLLAQSLATAITGAGFLAKGFATLGQGRVDLTGDSVTVAPVVAGSGLSVAGTAGSLDPNIPGSNVIKIRENFTGEELAQVVAAATGGAVAGNRVNFRDVLTTNISNLTTRNIVTQTGVKGVSVGSSGVRFLVSDTAESIAIRITQVINSTVGIQAAGIAATSDRGVVALQGGVLLNNIDPSFSVGGVPPGGLVTGIATIGDTLYAVSDAGGLYVVGNPTLAVEGRIGNYVTTATDLIGINFSGLSVGPQSVEGGRFANLLFGVTTQGDVYAFDTQGRLQPVFVGGATNINVGPNTTGIDFSTLDYNLFHVTNRRSGDAGHGTNAIDNGTRLSTAGGSSFYFGAGQNLISGNANSPFVVPRQDGQGVQNTYNFPGGAKGAIESNAFNLSGYSAADLPTLYFNYFLATEGVDGRDAFRVYAITEDGVEHLLATNNLATGPGTFDDEFDDPTTSVRPEIAKQYADNINVAVQPLFDNTNSWRQARVSLGPFAGTKSVRLRVEFSSGASFGDGTLGIRALAGNELVDGQTIEISGRTFEIDLGATLSVPSGVQIANFYAQPGSAASSRVVAVVGGVTYVLNDGRRTVKVGEVNVALQIAGDGLLSTFTADAVATRLAAAIQTNGVPTTTVPTSFLAEPNDELLSATSLPKVSGNIILTGNGALGTAQDVDLFRFEIPANAKIRVGMSPTVPNAFVGNVRLFDSSGNQLAIGSSTTPVEFISPTAQTIYIGFSSGGNSDYNPSVSGSGNAGSAGPYTATIELISDLQVVQTGSRLQITGGFAASGGADGLVVATGAPGTQGIPIVINATMSANQVAIELQRAISRQFSSGIASAYPVIGSTITLPGLVVSNAGPFGLAGLRSSDIFGTNGIARSTANNFEGVYVDDFVIGFAERGEIVTGAIVNSAFTADNTPNFTNPAEPVIATVTGSYQLEIRDASEYVDSSIDSTIADSRFRTFDTNDRLAKGLSVKTLPASSIIDGSSFQISDGVSTVTFEYEVELTPGGGNGVTPGRVRVGIPPGGSLPAGDNGSVAVARAMVAAINDPSVRSLLDVAAVEADGVDSLGNARINLFGSISISSNPGVLGEVKQTGLRGDTNRDRSAQGTVLIENSRFLFNSDVGIELSHGATATVAGQATNSVVGYPRNLAELNTERLIPGVVVQSNVVAFNANAGIRIDGIAGGSSGSDPVPFERVVNNTIIGGQIRSALATSPATFQGVVFPTGAIAFADAVTTFTAGTGVTVGFDIPARSIGAPDSSGRGAEPADGLTTVSLGNGGVLTVQFVDNLLTGSGDARPDLKIFETGEIESVRVAVSRDGVTFINVGVIGGVDTTIDLDASGFGLQDRFAFVRLTDLRQGTLTSGAVGADIDAVGALSSVAIEQFTAGGIAIQVTNNASPTLLNNVLANSATALDIDASSASTVIGGATFYRNTANGKAGQSLGQFSSVLPSPLELFVNPQNLVFTPRAGVPIIDSSIDSLEDRASLATVRNSIGLPPSPIIAPRLDVNGQLRIDDPTVESPLGSGERIFKDRGAEDRGDQVGPRSVLVSPRAEDLGLTSGQAETRGTIFDSFDIQLVDGIGPVDPTPGVGIDDASVTANTVLLSKDGVLLVEGVDYRFGYDASNNTIRLTPIAGIWEDNSVYVVRLLDARDSLLRLGSGISLADGALTTLLTSKGVIREFEVESGVRINVNALGANSLIDGQTITVFDGAFSLSFEINTNTLTGVGTIPVVVNATASAVEIAAALAAAIKASALNLTVNVSGTLVQLLGTSSLTTATPVAGTTLYTVSGAVGTRVGFGIGIPTVGNAISGTVQDGQTFTIRRGGNLVRTFEIDFGGGISTPGAIAVLNPANSTLDQFANAIVNAIGGAGLGLAPFNAGQGRIVLGGDANYSLDVSGSTLVQLGSAGQSATIPVIIPIDATVDEVVAAYNAAILNAGLAGVLTSAVGDRLVIEGVAAASGSGAVSLPIIRDEVGNLLQSNGTDGRNVLTIFVGGGFDYGDAPSPYQTLLSAGGPRHRVDRALTLGQSITPEADAILPDGDVDDGVALINNAASGFPALFSVEINSADGRAFYLDAWVDWNKNGVFENSEVTRFRSANAAGTSAILGVGVNTISVNVPDGVSNGQTFARFRLSEVSGLGPNGDADSGEVEDLSILVQSNPYQNPAVASDVNKSGVVTPLDALNVINLLAIYNRNRLPTDPASIPLNPPPAYINDIVNGRFLPDVNGDGKVSPQDALVVINELARTRRNAAAGEGEQFIPISNGLLASPLTVATSTTTMKRAIAETVEMPSIVDSNPTRMSVFDSPQVVALDDILNNIADDNRETSSSAASATDMVFNGLGLGL